MKRTYAKRAVLAVWLLALSAVLSGCVSQISEREMADLSGMEILLPIEAPLEDRVESREELVTLYFLSEDGTSLVPVTRAASAREGASRAQAALDALLEGPAEEDRDVMWPDLGVSRSIRLLEVSSGVATVDLPAHARTLAQEMIYAVRMAIAHTLTELPEISYVNVLIGGREEGLDLGATLPVGTFARVDDLDAGARYSRLHEQRGSGEGVTLLTTLYFPSQDGKMILPEVRSVAYAQVSPIEYLYTLLGELGKGASMELCAQHVPAPLEFIEKMPEIVRTEDGYVAIELCFDRELEEELARCNLTLGVYMAMLTDTLMGFVPGVEGIRVSVGDLDVTALDEEQTPDHQAIAFEQGLAARSHFAGYVGAPATMYVMDGEGLRRVQRVMCHTDALDARKRLEALMLFDDEAAFALPKGLTAQDVIAVRADRDVVAVNLSGAFRDALRALTPQQERAAVYAMVNTLTENAAASQVAFFFEGEQIETLAGALEMRGTFMRNPGMVVN